MKDKEIIWENEGVEIKQIVPVCDCGGRAYCKGTAGCSHSEEFTYTYQCEKCKNIEMFDGVFSFNSEEDYSKRGWKMVTTLSE